MFIRLNTLSIPSIERLRMRRASNPIISSCPSHLRLEWFDPYRLSGIAPCFMFGALIVCPVYDAQGAGRLALAGNGKHC